MRIYTHGKKKGCIELLVSEQRLLERAHSLLCDIEAHANVELADSSNAAMESLGVILEKVMDKEVAPNV